MASWSPIIGGGIGGSSTTQSGFGTFNKNPFAITTPNSTGWFGSNSSSMASNTVNSLNAGNPFATQPPRPVGGSTTKNWFQTPPPPGPFGSSLSSSNSIAGNPFSPGASTSLPAQSTSSITTAPFWTNNQTCGAPPFSSVNSKSLFNQTNSVPASPSTTLQLFQSSSPASSNSTAGAPFSFGIPTSSSISTSPFGTKNQTGGAPFSAPFSSSSSVNSTSLFNKTNSVPAFPAMMTSPFGITTPSTSSSSSPFGITTPATSSSSTGFSFAPPSTISPFPQTPMTTMTSPFGITMPSTSSPFAPPSMISPFPQAPSPFGITTPSTSSPFAPPSIPPSMISPFPQSSGTTSAFNNTKGSSGFAPFTSTVPWTPDSKGTRQKTYEKTREEGSLKNEMINSISAMPFYKNKSHEELKLEDYKDYKLTGKTGTNSSFPFINTSTPTCPVNPPSTPSFPEFPIANPPSTPSFPKFPIAYPSPFTSPSLPPSTPSPSIFKPTPFPPFSQPVTMPIPPLGNFFPATQTTPTIPNSGTGFTTSTVPATGSIITSIPETVSQGPSPVMNPFATEVRDTLPIRTVQYGISCLPVSESPQLAKKMPLVNVRQLSVGRRRPSIEKYKPKEDEKKVPFFEELPGIYKKGPVLIPRENPRSWVVLPNEEQGLEKNFSKLSVPDHSATLCKTEGGTERENSSQARECAPKMNLTKEIMHGDGYSEKENMAAVIISNADDHKDPNILAMIPQLKCQEYYMEPSMEDLAKNELRKPGFCSHVKDFVIGKLNCGSIKFLGETDVRSLDVESIVKFGNRDVNVYEDEKGKPPVGQGLNKAAEITLVNIKCIDKNSGMQYIGGPKVDQYKKFLMRKAMEQGSEFVSFDPVKGEWRFKVEHF